MAYTFSVLFNIGFLYATFAVLSSVQKQLLPHITHDMGQELLFILPVLQPALEEYAQPHPAPSTGTSEQMGATPDSVLCARQQ